MGRILGIDHGDVRIGIAMSDETAFLASPLTTVLNGKAAADEIAALVQEHNVETIVIGLPLNMDGSAGPATEKVRRFSKKLASKTDVPIVESDERLTTVTAHYNLREAGLDGKKRKGVVDMAAAQVILQDWLDAQP
ncbi:Holliday junction resolvase RuvX [Tichowtungia aerotolerans]|uniref:Putative pre-16S rRNA nuclease n=1 Tax=Tichowtungia aerotolerans TaxID=2697043 RepID=A0A6P1M8S1_9BACT|nr:Holliday junction resolvase RuvX [Tichowtungia aerotolerans]QHI67976.1 Holliday junction resolvase RuvX [Tichowtungia aerotolerans]